MLGADVRAQRVVERRIAIDRDDRSCRRLRFTLEGHATTRGAVAEVDWLELLQRHGVWWPARSCERVVHPFLIFRPTTGG